MSIRRLAALPAAALVLAPAAQAITDTEGNLEVYTVLKNETAFFTRDGAQTGLRRSTTSTAEHEAGELMKSEWSANLFINGDFSEDSRIHAQLNLIYDTEAIDGYKAHRLYSQQDYLRELYVDTFVELPGGDEMDLRMGKQQVVWGKADGIKLLDIVNPTDYRELVQNTFEDSRIPIWMIKAEKFVGDTATLQGIVSQWQPHQISGLSSDGDSGHPFIFKGVDTITGPVNGFLNIAPRLGDTATAFHQFARFPSEQFPTGASLLPFTFATVNDFATGQPTAGGFAPACNLYGFGPTTNAACLNAITQTSPFAATIPGLGDVVIPGGGNENETNLIDAQTQDQWDPSQPNSAFEYMPDATFATFNTFAGARSMYERDYPERTNTNFGLRWSDSLGGGTFSYTLNYLYAYDPNPSVSISWRNNAGETLTPVKVTDPSPFQTGRESVLLTDAEGNFYGAFDPSTATPTNPAGEPNAEERQNVNLVFTERLRRSHYIGGSFDTSLESDWLGPWVLRAELLYQKDARVPVIDRDELAIGNVTQALRPEKADFFKYVVGADFIFLTNLTISPQFIQFINLDYVDDNGGRRYTGDPSTLHLDNGLKKGEKYENFVSLFLSKPFGEGQLGRVNDIIIWEEGGGYWNRLDAEYQFSDALIGLAEWNQYWGSDDTQFGQFEDSSNFQVGIKYIIE